MLRFTFYGALPRQMMHWQGPSLTAIERLLDETVATSDQAGRQRRLAEVQNIIQNEVPYGTLHFKKQLTGWSKQLRGFRPGPTYGFTLDGVGA